MPDPRFFRREGPFQLRELAAITGAEMQRDADAERELHDVSPLETATPADLSFIDNPRYLAALSQSRAGACLVHPERVSAAPAGMALLISRAPYLAYARAARAFYPERPDNPVAPAAGAVVDPSAVVGDGTVIAPGAVIGPDAEIGRDCVIGANAVIGAAVRMGDACRIGAGSSLAFCILGDRVRLYAGVRIGEPGFGFAAGPEGFETVPQLGRVIVGDDVEIGANSTIDRGSGPDTVIGAGTRIDNLVQIGHNVRIGRNCIIVAQVGIAGSTTLEDNVVAGGQAGFAGHITIGTGAQIGAQAGIPRDVAPGARLMGTPAVPVRQFYRQAAVMERLAGKKVKKDG